MLSSWRVCCSRVPQRWVFAVMGCLALMNAYTMRISLSLAITEMVKTTETSSNDTSPDQTCAASDSSSSSSSSSGTYDWDVGTQGIILSSFFWGYIITQIPGGVLADRFGGKHTLGLGILSTAIFTLLTPIVVEKFDSTGLIVLRFLMGLGEGTTFPAINCLISKWAPPDERSKLGTVAITGAQLGTIVGNGLSGILIQNSPIGWPIVFYVFGALSILWFFAWVILCYSHPDVHPFISETEKDYLRTTMVEHTRRVTKSPPWWDLLTSVPLWALLAGKFGHDWGFYTMVTDLPLYMSNVLRFSIQANGLLTALPYVFMWGISILSSWLADWLINSGRVSRTNVRKILTTISCIGPAIFIITASYAGCDRTIVVALFTVGMGFMGPFYPGMMVNGLDLSPNYSGTLMAIMTAVGAVAGILAPIVIAYLTPNQTLSEWRLVFWITFVIFLVANVIFVAGGDGEIQYWNDPDSKKRGERDVERNGISEHETPDESKRKNIT